MSVLVTGAAGFIGFHVCRALLHRGEEVIGVDNLDPYYDVALKRARLSLLTPSTAFRMIVADVADRAAMTALFDANPQIDRVVHLAAKAGVRHSLIEPDGYVDSNVNDRADEPRSVYAVTKRAGELMADAWSHLRGIRATGLRYFTVYGPWGRPDMAPHLFAKALFDGVALRLYHFGRARRDLTYIDDVAAGTLAALDRPPPDPLHRLYNLGGSESLELSHIIKLFEAATGKTAKLELVAAPPGDVAETWADISASERELGWKPRVPAEAGISRFVTWYRDYYRV
jgi:UDP-glucuronate 4-epimerase